MERREYAILAVIAAAVVGIGVFTTSRPLPAFFAESTRQFLTTTAAMAWITWWALVVGFAIAGGVEAWTSDEQVADLLDGHGPREIGYGSLFGFVSSSCSYSAVATAKNLFKKGGSAAATIGAFMFASTNLVIEIGAVIWILLGWQFLLADILGGFVLIGLMAVGFVYVVPDEVVEQARENIQEEGPDKVQDPVCGMEVDPDEADYSTEVDGETYYFCSQSCKDSFDPEEADTTIREQATSLSGWQALADKQWKEWGMLWDEIAIGFIFAGLVAGFIPEQVWTSVFSGATFGLPVYVVWTAVLGAVIGVATFVCSVGNVPFGAVLFSNGLPFGSVLSYIYADLIVPPIMEAYREYYGSKFAAVLSAMIFVSAVVTGVLMHFVFLGAGLIPPAESVQIAEVGIELNYKLVLNVLATGLFAALYWLHRAEPAGPDSGGQSAQMAD
ncbi:permease [Haloarcula onubensis]|uniref:Permease n=1 Tax=Haloarcula onubensis TaxID=2950539 RepID=A0ABU2FKS3_9EURY|nr:permease [Halomicroarcula sp. S3CR25-11]MDS0281356.1 permease [Halomicroarcula sp. S3CR25-11]